MAFVFPLPLVPLPVVTSLPDVRVHPVTGKQQEHVALDVRASVGTPVYAAESGTVVDIQSGGAGGLLVVLQHDNSTMHSLYMHLSRVDVVKGQHVVRGQPIALSGNTGTMTTGPHLHWELRESRHGKKLDPLNYLPSSLKLPLKAGGFVQGHAMAASTVIILLGAAGYFWWRRRNKRGLV